jgi:hypothetical protein
MEVFLCPWKLKIKIYRSSQVCAFKKIFHAIGQINKMEGLSSLEIEKLKNDIIEDVQFVTDSASIGR